MTNLDALRLAEELEEHATGADYVEAMYADQFRGTGVDLRNLLSSAASLIREQQDRIRTLEGERATWPAATRELCRIYFDIAAEAIGEDEVRRKRDEMIPAASAALTEEG
jgi:hypothetical protein